MARLTLVLLLLGLGVAVSTVVDLQKRIIGGRKCGPLVRHYHVKLVDGKYDLLCGGSLISDEWILTAAHCYERKMYAVLGVHPGPGKRVEIKAAPKIYKDTGNRQHDLMLLKLPTATKIQPVELPDPCTRPALGQTVWIAGHAATGGGPNGQRAPTESPTLQCATTDVVRCDGLNLIVNNLPANHQVSAWSYQHWFCGQRPGVDICLGDSGGGVVTQNKIYGVISFAGNGGYICRQPAAFMDICNQDYLNWIKDTIKKPNKKCGLNCG